MVGLVWLSIRSWISSAPGLILEKKGKTAILLPGPPNELKPMFEEYVVPYLQKNQPEIIVSQMVKISGIGESQVAEEIQCLALICGENILSKTLL